MRELKTLIGLLGLAALAGCATGVDVSDGLVGSDSPKLKTFTPNAMAGIPIPSAKDDPKRFEGLVANNARRWGYSRDPFALTSAEKSYETEQGAERLYSSAGGFSVEYQPPAEVSSAPVYVEPQPYRRLSGVIVGDSVLALLEMGDGRTEIIRPGVRIPNSPWRVASIDEDKAVLVRSGNVQPKRITVRLESPPGGVGTTMTGGLGGVGSSYGGGMSPGLGRGGARGGGMPSMGGKGGGYGAGIGD